MKHFNDNSIYLRIGLCVLGLTIALTAAEIVSGYFYYPVGNALIHRIPDPVLGWRLEPNAKFTNQTGKVFAKVTYNSRGWHDNLHPYEKASGIFRILVLGDSFIEGYSVDLEDTFAFQLTHILKEKGKLNVEVINLGVGGYGTLQEYLVLKNEGFKYHPDLVLLGFGLGNDLSDNSLELEKDREGVESIKYLSRPFLLPGPDNEWNVTMVDYQTARATYDRAVREVEAASVWRKSHLYQLLHPLQLRWKPRGKSPNPNWELQLLLPHQCKETEDFKAAWIITRRILARLKKEINEAHAKLIVFTVPSIFEADPKRITKNRNTSERINDFCMEPPIGYDHLKTILNQEGIQWIHLLPAFRAKENHQELFLLDGHWNRMGHQLAALQVAENLKQ